MQRNRAGLPVIQGAFYWTCYWIGIVMAGACLFLVLAGDTESLWRFEHVHIPLSWVAGTVAMLAFLMAELCESTPSIDSRTERAPEMSQTLSSESAFYSFQNSSPSERFT